MQRARGRFPGPESFAANSMVRTHGRRRSGIRGKDGGSSQNWPVRRRGSPVSPASTSSSNSPGLLSAAETEGRGVAPSSTSKRWRIGCSAVSSDVETQQLTPHRDDGGKGRSTALKASESDPKDLACVAHKSGRARRGWRRLGTNHAQPRCL
jgi:hypothetical protein